MFETMKQRVACTLSLALMSPLAWAADTLPEGNQPGNYPLNLQAPKSGIAEQIFDLHSMMLVVCLGIFFVVFGVMFYSIYAHRKSKGAQAAHFHENHVVEVIWTVIPFVILIALCIPAAKTVIAQKDSSNAAVTVKVTGYQWKWGYNYIDDGIEYVSALSTPRDQIDDYDGKSAAKNAHYLLEVEPGTEMVVPVGKKVRLLLTANDVIHAWWVPQLGVKQDAIPGFIRDAWFKADTPGIYRGQCAELCGKDHGFMPIVVRAVPQADYDKWKADTKARLALAKDDPNKVWALPDLVARGKGVYETNCVACHQANGQGVPGTYPALAGSKIATGPIADHLGIVLKGKAGTPMPAWKQLSDTDIAAVVTYERNAWGNNKGDLLQPAQVKAARQ